MPDLREEEKLWQKGEKIVVGLDEAGRGCLAGQVVAAAVMINSKFKSQISKLKMKNLKDSKKLSSKQREKFYKIINRCPYIEWATASVGPKVIDRINIKNAAELAMEKALRNLERKIKKQADFLIIDGNQLKNQRLKSYNFKLQVKADEKILSCKIASIIAKVKRDKIMEKYSKKYPKYGFEKHRGYPTKFHKEMLKKYGLTIIHRRSFAPCKNLLK